MSYGEVKVKFKDSKHDRVFTTVGEPVVEGMNILTVDTDEGVVFINIDSSHYIVYKES